MSTINEALRALSRLDEDDLDSINSQDNLQNNQNYNYSNIRQQIIGKHPDEIYRLLAREGRFYLPVYFSFFASSRVGKKFWIELKDFRHEFVQAAINKDYFGRFRNREFNKHCEKLNAAIDEMKSDMRQILYDPVYLKKFWIELSRYSKSQYRFKDSKVLVRDFNPEIVYLGFIHLWHSICKDELYGDNDDCRIKYTFLHEYVTPKEFKLLQKIFDYSRFNDL